MLDYHGGLVPAMLVSAVLGWLSAQLLAPRPLYPALSDARIPPLPPGLRLRSWGIAHV